MLAFDFTSDQWVERKVEVCHRNFYQGSLIELSTQRGSIVATAYHPIWVLEGHDLANRPRPRKLADTEDEGLALRGRWVNSNDLMAGDLIYSTEGRELRFLKIVQTYEEQFEVCNLTIAQNHSFAVGNDGVLVHNTGDCGNAARVGGLGYPGSMPGAPRGPLTGLWRGRTINVETNKINIRNHLKGPKNPPVGSRTARASETGTGLDYAWNNHGHLFGPNAQFSKSKFSISKQRVKELLARRDVVSSPVRKSGTTGNYIREVDVGEIVGHLPLNKGGALTQVITVITDVKGNLVNVFPGSLGRGATL